MAKVLGKPSADDVKRVAVAALVAALDDSKEQARKKPGMTGMRAVATGAVLYTAGRAVLSGRRFVNDRLNGDDGEVEEEDSEEPVAEEDDDFEDEEEPEAEEDEDFEDEEEPEAEEDEDFEDEEEPEAEEDEDFDGEEEPEAEEDEDFDDEDEDDLEERSSAKKPPRHRDTDDEDLPERPSRRREPVGRR